MNAFSSPSSLLDSNKPPHHDPSLSHDTLFLGDLAMLATEELLKDLFEPFGEVAEIRVKRAADSKKKLGYGFVRFSQHEDAARALSKLNGFLVKGRALRMNWAKNAQPGSGKQRADNHHPQTAQVLASFISRDVKALVTEEVLRRVFSRFGEVVDATVKKSQLNPESNLQTGYGFVHFADSPEGIRSALLTLDEVRNVIIDDVAYDCRMSDSLRSRLASGAPSALRKQEQPVFVPEERTVTNKFNTQISFSGPAFNPQVHERIESQQLQPQQRNVERISFQTQSKYPPLPSEVIPRNEQEAISNHRFQRSSVRAGSDRGLLSTVESFPVDPRFGSNSSSFQQRSATAVAPAPPGLSRSLSLAVSPPLSASDNNSINQSNSNINSNKSSNYLLPRAPPTTTAPSFGPPSTAAAALGGLIVQPPSDFDSLSAIQDFSRINDLANLNISDSHTDHYNNSNNYHNISNRFSINNNDDGGYYQRETARVQEPTPEYWYTDVAASMRFSEPPQSRSATAANGTHRSAAVSQSYINFPQDSSVPGLDNRNTGDMQSSTRVFQSSSHPTSNTIGHTMGSSMSNGRFRVDRVVEYTEEWNPRDGVVSRTYYVPCDPYNRRSVSGEQQQQPHQQNQQQQYPLQQQYQSPPQQQYQSPHQQPQYQSQRVYRGVSQPVAHGQPHVQNRSGYTVHPSFPQGRQF